MKRKGEKLPSVNVEGTSEAKFAFRDGQLVKVCATCEEPLDRETGRCPAGH